jgi:hypothetical protein
MNDAEIRLLRFIQAENQRDPWVFYGTILNTEALLPGDEKALPGLLSQGLIEQDPVRAAYRVTNGGAKTLQRRLDPL